MYVGLINEYAEFWPVHYELLALIAEQTSLVANILLNVHAKKGTPIPDPLEIPRPARDRAPGVTPPKTDVISFSEFQQRTTARE